MSDLQVSFGSFSATTANIAGQTEAGKAFMVKTFGECVASVEMPKSKVPDFHLYAVQNGLTVG